MLSRSKGQHKIIFQQLSLSVNPKVTKAIIICFGLVSSLTALLMILAFMGFNIDSLNALGISNQGNASVADTLAGLVKVLGQRLAKI